MDDLIPIINELQSVFKTTGSHEVKLPQIVVVGAQSSGKSSVLESLVRKPFLPRGTGIVTRCPIIIQLNQVKDGRTHEVDQGVAGVEEWCQFSKSANFPDKVYTDFDEVRVAIEDVQVQMAGDKKGISMEPIILEVFSPNVIDLTVVDLPGIVKLAMDGQPADIEEQVYNLIMKYIQDESAIILAVSAANADIATSESIKIAQKVDPDGNRTIAVVTKLDLMDKGTDAAELLRGDTIHVKLGIIGVVNRSQADINNNKSMEETFLKEDAWLRTTYPDLHALGRIGTPQLAKTLNKLLKDHIHKNLPHLISRIAKLSDNCEKELQKLGQEISDDPEDCAWLIVETTQHFMTKFKQLVHLRPLDLNDMDTDLFAVDVNEAFRQMRDEIVFDGSPVEASRILKMLKKTQNFEGFSSIEEVFKSIVKQEIKKMECPAVSCAQSVHDLLSRTAGTCFDDPRLKYLNAIIKGAVDDLMATHLNTVIAGIKQHIELETRMIFSSDEGFVRLLTKEAAEANATASGSSSVSFGSSPVFSGSSSVSFGSFPLSAEHGTSNSSDAKTFRIKELILKYLQIVKQELCDYIPKYAMFHLGDGTIDGIMDAVKSATRGRETELVSEPDDNRILRKRQQDMLRNLQDASKIIRKIKSQGWRR